MGIRAKAARMGKLRNEILLAALLVAAYAVSLTQELNIPAIVLTSRGWKYER